MHESESAVFLVQAFLVVRNQFWKQFSNKVLYNYYSKKKLERFGQYLKSEKMDFPLYFQNVIWPGGGGLFLLAKKISEKAKYPQICPRFGGNVGET